MNETFILMPLMLFVVLALDRYLKWNAARAAREQSEAQAKLPASAAADHPPQDGGAASRD